MFKFICFISLYFGALVALGILNVNQIAATDPFAILSLVPAFLVGTMIYAVVMTLKGSH